MHLNVAPPNTVHLPAHVVVVHYNIPRGKQVADEPQRQPTQKAILSTFEEGNASQQFGVFRQAYFSLQGLRQLV